MSLNGGLGKLKIEFLRLHLFEIDPIKKKGEEKKVNISESQKTFFCNHRTVQSPFFAAIKLQVRDCNALKFFIAVP